MRHGKHGKNNQGYEEGKRSHRRKQPAAGVALSSVSAAAQLVPRFSSSEQRYKVKLKRGDMIWLDHNKKRIPPNCSEDEEVLDVLACTATVQSSCTPAFAPHCIPSA